MTADLYAVFADALAARPAHRCRPCSGTRQWREWLHWDARLAFDRAHPDVARHWYRRSRFLTYRVAADDPRRAIWRAEFRAYLATALRWYRRAKPINTRPKRADAFASEEQRLRIFGEGA
jgi:hypothetical protein